MGVYKLIDKETFLKHLEKWQAVIRDVMKRYQKALEKETEGWKRGIYMMLIGECRKALEHNEVLRIRAEIEEPYLLYYLDERGNLSIMRVLPEESKKILKKYKKINKNPYL